MENCSELENFQVLIPVGHYRHHVEKQSVFKGPWGKNISRIDHGDHPKVKTDSVEMKNGITVLLTTSKYAWFSWLTLSIFMKNFYIKGQNIYLLITIWKSDITFMWKNATLGSWTKHLLFRCAPSAWCCMLQQSNCILCRSSNLAFCFMEGQGP